MSALDGVEATLRRWGITTAVDTVPGYPGSFAPTHVMVHHTASAPPAAAPSARIVRTGRPGIPGPLCHLLVRRDFRVEVVSRGRANHAGVGAWPGIGTDEGNHRCIGIEIEHAGTTAEPWTPAYMGFCRRVSAAVLDHLNQPATHLVAHKEYAPDRKIDPFRWAMDAERREVARLLASGPPVNLLEELMSDPQERAALVAEIAAEVLHSQQSLGPSAKRELGRDTASLFELAQAGTAVAIDARQAVGRVEADLADGVQVEVEPGTPAGP